MRISVQVEFDKAMDVETPKSVVTLGRSPNRDVMIPHESISRSHCKIELEKGMFYITDLGSSNGTFIDGKRLTPHERTPFISSSQITLGKLECEISEGGLTEEHVTKAHSIKAILDKEVTTTMRLARLDLNKPSITLEMEKKPKPKGPRNPISEAPRLPPKTKVGENKRFNILLFLLMAGIAAYLVKNLTH